MTIETALQTHQGTPLVLAAICKITLARLDVHVDIIPFDGSFKCFGLATNHETCVELCDSKWQAINRNSLASTHAPFSWVRTILRMSMCIAYYNAGVLGMRPRPTRSILVAYHRQQILIWLLTRMHALPPAFELPGRLTHFMDPAVFYCYKLISKRRMRRVRPC